MNNILAVLMDQSLKGKIPKVSNIEALREMAEKSSIFSIDVDYFDEKLIISEIKNQNQ